MKEGEWQHEKKGRDKTSDFDGVRPWQRGFCDSLTRPYMVDQQGSFSVYLHESEPIHFQCFTGFMKQVAEGGGNETRHMPRACYSAGIF
jgi:hypothetical protein